VQRACKKHTSPIGEGQRIQYNFVKPHMALEDQTPAEMAGVRIKTKNKWMDLFENARL
jgi:hypothetical protein